MTADRFQQIQALVNEDFDKRRVETLRIINRRVRAQTAARIGISPAELDEWFDLKKVGLTQKIFSNRK